MKEQILKKKIKKAKQIKKEVGTTLSWLDISSIEEDAIVLKKEKRVEVVKGIKIIPRNILIENEKSQENLINALRGVFNRLNFPIYHQFVYSKVNIMEHYNHLTSLLSTEENPVIRELIQDDLEKANAYSSVYQELSFFMMIASSNNKELEKNFNDLIQEMDRTGLRFELLRKTDYFNLCAYLFENDLILDYYFTTGEFAVLKEENLFNKEGLYDI